MPVSLHPASDGQSFEPVGNNALEECARKLGSSLGRAVVALRNTRTKLKLTASGAADAAVSQIQEVQQQVRTGYEGTKANAQQLLNNHPVHVVLAAGAAGLLLGMGLRIWRASREP